MHLVKLGASESQLLVLVAYNESLRGYPRRISWAKDCRHLVYERDGQVYVYELISNQARSRSGNSTCVVPRRQRIAYIDPDRTLTLVPATGGDKLMVRREKAAGAPSWSPDGDYLVVGLRWRALPSTQLVVVRVRDGNAFAVQRAYKGLGDEWGWMRVPELVKN